MSAGLRLGRHRATTAQLGAAYPFAAEAGLGPGGVVLGRAAAGGGAFAFDPFDAYTRGLVDSPNLVVAGMPRVGKSAALKCFLWRAVGALRSPGGGPRWAAVIDPKGEYAPLAAALGLERVRLCPGGRHRLNPLDPGAGGPEAAAARAAMVAALVAAVLGRPLAPLEDAALGWAVALLDEGRRPEPTLVDLARILSDPPEALAARARRTSHELAAGLEEARLGLGKLVERDLRGLFDGPSTLRAGRCPRGVVLDLSAVHADPAALGLVMVAATGWLQSALAGPAPPDPDSGVAAATAAEDSAGPAPTPRRIQVIDEAWALLGQERSARYLQACWKLCSAYGVANVAVFHRLSDLRSQADDGTATAKITMGLLADADTRVLFRQGPDQVAEATELLGLTPAEAFVLPRLAKGQALWKLRERALVVDHLVAPAEWALIDTDQKLRG